VSITTTPYYVQPKDALVRALTKACWDRHDDVEISDVGFDHRQVEHRHAAPLLHDVPREVAIDLVILGVVVRILLVGEFGDDVSVPYFDTFGLVIGVERRSGAAGRLPNYAILFR
jgi:hypothetical protein